MSICSFAGTLRAVRSITRHTWLASQFRTDVAMLQVHLARRSWQDMTGDVGTCGPQDRHLTMNMPHTCRGRERHKTALCGALRGTHRHRALLAGDQVTFLGLFAIASLWCRRAGRAEGSWAGRREPLTQCRHSAFYEFNQNKRLELNEA